MNVESAIYGALMGVVIVFVVSRMGVPMTPWPAAVVGVLFAIAIWFVLRLAGVDSAVGITIGVLASSFIVGIWRRLAHRPA